MTLTDPDAAPHARHSMLLVPAATKGIEILRAMKSTATTTRRTATCTFVSATCACRRMRLCSGAGAASRSPRGGWGPGASIIACARSARPSGRSRRCAGAQTRDRRSVRNCRGSRQPDIIAEARMSIEMARLLCLKAAWAMDTQGVRAAAPLISQIKVIAPRIALEVIDQAVQLHGGAGVSQDFPLARMWTHVRTLRLADGPDAVHRRVIAKAEMKRYTNEAATR